MGARVPHFRPYEALPALQVCANMRLSDAHEIFALHEKYDHLQLFTLLNSVLPGLYAEIVWAPDASKPIALMAARTAGINVAQAMMFGTDDLTPRFIAAICQRARKVALPRLREMGVHRVQCHSIAGYGEAHRLIQHAGGTREGVRRALGKNGEDFIEFAWVDEEISNRGKES